MLYSLMITSDTDDRTVESEEKDTESAGSSQSWTGDWIWESVSRAEYEEFEGMGRFGGPAGDSQCRGQEEMEESGKRAEVDKGKGRGYAYYHVRTFSLVNITLVRGSIFNGQLLYT